MYESDTIAAIATAPGTGAVGVIRVSGPASTGVARAITTGPIDPGSWPNRQLVRVDILVDGKRIDDGLAVLMRAPRSYTGEDVLELHCHGSPTALQEILRAALAAGARPAEAGEFTKRAYLNGKLDLAQAEAVMDLVRCRTPTAAVRAADQLSGALSRHLAELRQRLIALKGHLEVLIDFSDEDVDLEQSAVAAEAAALREHFAVLSATYQSGRIYRDGLRVALIGRPNVGKSSLLNALARANRAIVTDIPGTTRDVLEEQIDIGGVPIAIADTAGLRDGAAGDRVEELGIERARSTAAAADLVIAVLDRSVAWAAPPYEAADEQRMILALNKTDLPAAWTDPPRRLAERADAVVAVSATAGTGLVDLEAAIVAAAGRNARDATPPLTNTRQRDAVDKVAASLGDAMAAAGAGAPPEIVAVDIQLALQHLGTVTGEIAGDEVLDAVFREFCLGK